VAGGFVLLPALDDELEAAAAIDVDVLRSNALFRDVCTIACSIRNSGRGHFNAILFP
jgi:hypothetical protein